MTTTTKGPSEMARRPVTDHDIAQRLAAWQRQFCAHGYAKTPVLSTTCLSCAVAWHLEETRVQRGTSAQLRAELQWKDEALQGATVLFTRARVRGAMWKRLASTLYQGLGATPFIRGAVMKRWRTKEGAR